MQPSNDIAVVGGGLFLPPDSPATAAVKKALQYPNPLFNRAQAMRASGKRIPLPDRYLNGWFEIPVGHPWAGGIAAPRHLSLTDLAPEVKVVHKFSQPEA